MNEFTYPFDESPRTVGELRKLNKQSLVELAHSLGVGDGADERTVEELRKILWMRLNTQVSIRDDRIKRWEVIVSGGQRWVTTDLIESELTGSMNRGVALRVFAPGTTAAEDGEWERDGWRVKADMIVAYRPYSPE